jgi:hypothetical protein
VVVVPPLPWTDVVVVAGGASSRLSYPFCQASSIACSTHKHTHSVSDLTTGSDWPKQLTLPLDPAYSSASLSLAMLNAVDCILCFKHPTADLNWLTQPARDMSQLAVPFLMLDCN